jgi:SAM-dependent methyltransferase
MSLEDKPWLLRELLDLPYLPSPLAVIDAALNALSLKGEGVFADLGCGDATVLVRAAQRRGFFCVGFEIDRRLLLEAKRNIKQAGLSSKVDVVYADAFTVDLSRFDMIYVYPFPPIALRLSEKLRSECKKGAVALVHDYPLPTLVPSEMVQVLENELHTHEIYVYRF